MKRNNSLRLLVKTGCLALAIVAVFPTKYSGAVPVGTIDAVSFNEIWAYLMAGEESKLKGDEPLTDVCYFGARIDAKGRLAGRTALPAALNKGAMRWHLVVAELGNHALTHFCLNRELPYRDKLIADIAAASAGFNGVQIDFEAVLAEDRDQFIAFLGDLKKKLGPGKQLSVALPARRKDVNDAYPYSAIAAVADRVIIMAYDQHWSGSAPGPVAGLSWCGEINAYAKSRIPGDKLVMGLPLYGRAWQSVGLARAVVHEHVQKLLGKKQAKIDFSKENGPSMSYEEKVTVSVFFNTVESVLERIRLYAARKTMAIAFWRIGQGDPGLWKYLSVAKDGGVEK